MSAKVRQRADLILAEVWSFTHTSLAGHDAGRAQATLWLSGLHLCTSLRSLLMTLWPLQSACLSSGAHWSMLPCGQLLFVIVFGRAGHLPCAFADTSRKR